MPLVVSVAEEPWGAPDSVALRTALRDELDERYGGAPVADRTDPVVVFVVARAADGTPVGCGGLQRVGSAETELAELYVVSEARGTGTAEAVLKFLEAKAKGAGLTLITLAVGNRQPDAMRFVERAGYRRVPTLDSEVVRYARAVADD